MFFFLNQPIIIIIIHAIFFWYVKSIIIILTALSLENIKNKHGSLVDLSIFNHVCLQFLLLYINAMIANDKGV
jgi:hypothetical protein